METVLIERPNSSSRRSCLERVNSEVEKADLVLRLALDHASAALTICRGINEGARDPVQGAELLFAQATAIRSELNMLGEYLQNVWMPSQADGNVKTLLQVIFDGDQVFHNLIVVDQISAGASEAWFEAVKNLVLSSKRRVISLKGRLVYALKGGGTVGPIPRLNSSSRGTSLNASTRLRGPMGTRSSNEKSPAPRTPRQTRLRHPFE